MTRGWAVLAVIGILLGPGAVQARRLDEVPSPPPSRGLDQPAQPRPGASDVANFRAVRLTIDQVAGTPQAGQDLTVRYGLSNRGTAAVTGFLRGRFDSEALTGLDGKAPSEVTLEPGAATTGELRLKARKPASRPLLLQFIHRGACRDRPGPNGRPIRVCDDQILASASQDLTVAGAPPPPPSLQEIAAYWAPVLSHDVDNGWGDRVWGDYITKVDFDGDWRSSNNWDNLLNHPLPAVAYYWVVETQDHWFIGYAFFHPRDWSNANLPTDIGADIAHNNDIEAVSLAIRRSASHRMGRFLAMVTVAHTDFYSYVDTDTPGTSDWFERLSLSRTLSSSSEEDIDGDVDFVADAFGLHPVVYVEAEGHGIYGEPRDGHGVDDWAPFGRNPVTDWRGASWTGIVLPPKSGTPTVPDDRAGWGDGVIFHYEGVAENPRSGPGGAPVNFQVVGYGLTDVSVLWRRRNCGETFNASGGFPGGADPPWRLNDGNDNITENGVIFDRPAILFGSYFSGVEVGAMNPAYLRRSYDPLVSDCG